MPAWGRPYIPIWISTYTQPWSSTRSLKLYYGWFCQGWVWVGVACIYILSWESWDRSLIDPFRRISPLVLKLWSWWGVWLWQVLQWGCFCCHCTWFGLRRHWGKCNAVHPFGDNSCNRSNHKLLICVVAFVVCIWKNKCQCIWYRVFFEIPATATSSLRAPRELPDSITRASRRCL